MKKLTLTSLSFFFYCIGFSQNPARINSLKHQLANEGQDTNRVAILLTLYDAFLDSSKPDSAQVFAEKALDLATKINYPKGEIEALSILMVRRRTRGDTPKALSFGHKALRIAEKANTILNKGYIYEQFGLLYMLNLKDYPKAKSYLKQSIQEYEKFHDIDNLSGVELVLSSLYRRMNQLDSMLIYEQIAYDRYKNLNKSDQDGRFPMVMGQNHLVLGDYPLALSLFQKAVTVNHRLNISFQEAESLRGLALVYEKMNQLDSTIYYEKKAIEIAIRYDYKQLLFSFYKHLADIYEAKDKDTAWQYLKMAWDVNESVNGTQKIIALETAISEEQERQYQVEAERIASENRIKQYLFLGGLGILLLIAFILYRNNQQKRKANQVLEKTLATLKSTQAQLIQSEKLASLGELTAGIAHEIQNPLNFVNNFSELSVELIEDAPLPPEGEYDENWLPQEAPPGGWGLFLDDLKQNLSKINHHGKRASSIVSGMLEHSRASTGERAMTDINKLADEYLRLSYHGIRAKDSTFNADYELIIDENLPNINVVPQDMGRVLLNLINNAFWAVNCGTNFQFVANPKVIVKTEHGNNQLTIRVIDNGVGMSEEVKAKIFQPFFTTKPTGQGTGLGLSLAYDIITKGHGGIIEVESKEGEGTIFIVKLPI